MSIGRWLTVIVGAVLGSLVAVWWVRNRGLPLPSGSTLGALDSGDHHTTPPSGYIRLK